MDESTKGATVDAHLRQLRGYQGELVRDLIFGTVRLPSGWLGPGESTIIALDPSARLELDQANLCKVLLDQCTHLLQIVDRLIEIFIAEQRASGVRFAKNELDSLRRGRGPARVRDLCFDRLATWPESATAQMVLDSADALRESLERRARRGTATGCSPGELRSLLEPLYVEVRTLVLEWGRLKGLTADDAAFMVSEVLDQLIRTVTASGTGPTNLKAWTRSTAKWKWIAHHGGTALLPLDDERAGVGDGVGTRVSAKVDMQARLRRIAERLRDRGQHYASQGPSYLDDAWTSLVAAHIIDTADVELIEAVILEMPDGLALLRRELERRPEPLSPGRERAVIRLIRDTLRRFLQEDS